MIVHVASFLESIGGSIDKDHYLRPIPGRVGYAAYCRKPEYSKAKKKEMAAHAVVQNFRSINEEACVILRDPAQKALWQEKHLLHAMLANVSLAKALFVLDHAKWHKPPR